MLRSTQGSTMMVWWHRSASCITGSLWGESTEKWWIGFAMEQLTFPLLTNSRVAGKLIRHYAHVASLHCHYSDVTMSAMASQITGIMIVYSTVCSGVDQRKHQSSASLAFVRGIHQCPVNSPNSGADNVSIWWHHHGENARLLAS